MTPSSSLDGLFKYRRFDLAANTRRFSGAGRRALSSGLQSKILGKMPLTKAELADMLFEKIGLNKREAKDVVSFHASPKLKTLIRAWK